MRAHPTHVHATRWRQARLDVSGLWLALYVDVQVQTWLWWILVRERCAEPSAHDADRGRKRSGQQLLRFTTTAATAYSSSAAELASATASYGASATIFAETEHGGCTLQDVAKLVRNRTSSG